MSKVTTIIPCFNEQEVLPLLFERFTAAANTWGFDWEVICIDDGSTDLTWDLLQRQAAVDSRWRALALARNFGHQIALSAGLYHADGDVVAIIDADLQDPPEQICRFLAKWQEGYDVVYAIRRLRKESLFKRFCYALYYRLLARLVSVPIPIESGDFCVMDRRVVEVINLMPERNRFVRGLRAWSGFRQIGLEYERHARALGEIKYTYRKLIELGLDGIFSCSRIPLRLSIWLGIFVSIAAFSGVLIAMLQRLFASSLSRYGLQPVPGYATIVISILFLGGVHLLCLGILGEYLGRIYDEVKRRPQWILSNTIGIDAKTPPT